MNDRSNNILAYWKNDRQIIINLFEIDELINRYIKHTRQYIYNK